MQDQVNRSPFFFVGDKAKLIPQLLCHFPQSVGRYFEPFLGGGSVSLNISATEYHLSDVNMRLVEIHDRFRKLSLEGVLTETLCSMALENGLTCSAGDVVASEALKRTFPKTYYAHANKTSFGALRTRYNEAASKNPLELYLLLIYGFNRTLRFNREGKFNVPVGNVDLNHRTANALNQLQDFHRSNVNVFYRHCDFEQILSEAEPTVGDFVYLDPPYLITSAEYNARWTHEDDNRLTEMFDRLASLGVSVAMSNVFKYKGEENSSLIKWSRKYAVVEVESNYISRFDNRKKNIQEVLIKSF